MASSGRPTLAVETVVGPLTCLSTAAAPRVTICSGATGGCVLNRANGTAFFCIREGISGWGNSVAFGKSTSQRICPKQHTPKIG